MDVLFINKYTVYKEGQSTFFIDPKRREQKPTAGKPKPTTAATRMHKWNGVIRILGLCLAAIIIVMAIIGRMWILAVIGGILVAMYVIRIYQAYEQAKEQERKATVPPPSSDFSTLGKWVRYVRFGPHIELEDPGQTHTYQYSQITRISNDPAYITLWMDDDTQVRVAKSGFIIGTLDGFKQFIMGKTGRLIGPAPSTAQQPVQASQKSESDNQSNQHSEPVSKDTKLSKQKSAPDLTHTNSGDPKGESTAPKTNRSENSDMPDAEAEQESS